MKIGLKLKNKLLTIIFIFTLFNCAENKRAQYEDFNEDDFIETQGIITKTVGRRTFPNAVKNDIYFVYNLNKEKPDIGYELKSPYILHNGEPVIILIHKNNADISFFGARGIINEKDLRSYLKKCEEYGIDYYGVEKKYIN